MATMERLKQRAERLKMEDPFQEFRDAGGYGPKAKVYIFLFPRSANACVANKGRGSVSRCNSLPISLTPSPRCYNLYSVRRLRITGLCKLSGSQGDMWRKALCFADAIRLPARQRQVFSVYETLVKLAAWKRTSRGKGFLSYAGRREIERSFRSRGIRRRFP